MRQVQSKVKIQKREYKFLKDNLDKLSSYGKYIAQESYPPAGYDFYSPKISEEDGEYYFSWKHYDSCD